MHTLQLKIDDSIFDKFMGLLDILPKEKISVTEDTDSTSISFKEAQVKVQSSINNISNNQGIDIDTAFDKVLKS